MTKTARGATAIHSGVCCVLLTCAAGCDPFIFPPLDPGGPAGTAVAIEEVIPQANFPIAIAFAADGTAFYTEKETGQIRVITPAGDLLEEPFADVNVVANSERGLLGIALHPDFEENGYVYAFYTRSNLDEDTRSDAAAEDNRVVRFTANEARTLAVSEELILSLPVHPGPNHNGGNIHFGPDRRLYITLGELADSANSQDVDALPGRILRIDDDGSTPGDNPFGGVNPTFALGLRNSFDFTFDPVSGALFATENGTSFHDEVNRLPAGANGGWPLVEGSAVSQIDVDFGVYVEPAYSYNGIVVPTGIAFAPDATFGAARENQLFVAEFATGRIWMFSVSDDRGRITEDEIFTQGITGGITDIEFAPDGTLYVLTSESILRVVPVD